jgi:hypothetical protein
MSIPLPQVIGQVVPIIEEKVQQGDNKQFILCISKDLTPEDYSLFKNINVETFNDSIHRNIPIEKYQPFDLLVLDIRNQADRYTYMKQIQTHRKLYHVILYCHGFEKDENLIENPDNVISKLPEKQANKQEFLDLLLVRRIKKPRWYVSLFKCCFKTYAHIKN